MARAARLRRAVGVGYRRALPESLRQRVYRARRRWLTPAWDAELLTVVMPVYKVERYLEEAVDSILSQSYRNLELILVDDGSPDRSGAMCDEIAGRDPRVRVIHQENAGLGGARNTGIAAARGSYLAFADSDDYLLPDAYARMIRSLSDSGSDLATGNVLRRRGRQLEQSFIQMRSHSEDRVAVRLVDYDVLLSDTVAWNKVFRTDFFRQHVTRFPVRKLYEDTATIFAGLLAATGIDVIAEPVYVWRIRDEGDSITQQLLEVPNIRDRFEMLGHVEVMIRDAGVWPALGDRLLHKVLEVDLWVYVRILTEQSPEAAVAELRDVSARYWQLAPSQVRLGVPAERRVCFTLLADGRLHDMLAFRWWYLSREKAPPLRRTDGRVLLDVSSCPVELGELSDEHLDMSDLTEPIVNVTDVRWDGGTGLVITGYGYLRYLSDGTQRITVVATRADGRSIEWPAARMPMVESALWANDLTNPRRNDGFSVAVDVAGLQAAGGAVWRFAARIDDDDFGRSADLDKVWKLGSGAAIGPGRLPDGSIAVVKTATDQPLEVEIRPVEVAASHVTADRQHVTLSLTSEVPVDEVRMVAWDYPDPLVADRGADGSYTVDVPRAVTDDGHAVNWRVVAMLRDREVPVLAPGDLPVRWTSNDEGIRPVVRRNGQVVVEARTGSAIIEQLSCTGSGDLWLHGALLSAGDVEFGVAQPDGSPKAWHRPTVADGRFTVTLPVTHAARGSVVRPLATGSYVVHGRRAASGDRQPIEVLLTNDAATTLPVGYLDEQIKVRLGRHAGGLVGVNISAPVSDDLLGQYAQARLTTRYGATPRRLDDAVFFQVDVGANAADSALAIHQELLRRRTDIPLYWGVEDYSVPLPEGGIAVVKRSEEWFRLVNGSRYLVNNYGGLWGLTKDRGQRYLQTWHGTPLKYIGASEARHQGALKPRFDQIAAEAAEWDAFVSPSPYFSALVRSEFLYDGPVLETGYPRNDRIAVAGDDERAAMRELLDIPADARVLLYAPTFRDNDRKGWRAPLFDGLNLDRLLDLLGPDWMVLLRGHIFNANDNHADRSRGRLLDVTRHHDINDLYIASDLLVTDYSSVMFDYAVTGKPMAFFTPDIEAYVAGRGTYFDLREESPGPLCDEVAELAEHVRDPQALAAQWRSRYDAFRGKFAPWDDGKAAARVVDSFFG